MAEAEEGISAVDKVEGKVGTDDRSTIPGKDEVSNHRVKAEILIIIIILIIKINILVSPVLDVGIVVRLDT